jgi:uncharacterized membrane protein YhaH (DUF805 family)
MMGANIRLACIAPIMTNLFRSLFSFEGRISGARYFASGSILLALKFLVDHTIAAHFSHPWHIWNYFFPPADLAVFGLGASNPKLYLILWAVAIPFFWIGVALTLRRLRDSGMLLGLIFLFFIPIANLFFFVSLCFAPSAAMEQPLTPSHYPRGGSGAVLLGALFAAAIGIVAVYFGANVLARYGFGLFLAVPFFTGFIASWALNAGQLQSRSKTAAISAVVPIIIGVALIGFRVEGMVCLLMALPLALPFSIAGGLTARYCLSTRQAPSTGTSITACVAILPLLLLVEQSANLQPPVRAVTTSITVNAPVGVVWKNVIAFPPLASPSELLFRSGIAYPIGAQIVGSGPGAIRYCRFSTGDFVEPVTVWDENHLLAFNVASEPPSLHELGIGPIHTPHVDRNYMRSLHGQFRLVALDDHHTLLEGTTWYQDYFWPQAYWGALSDAIIHRIHTRVLDHVKAEAESQSFAESTSTR